MTFRKLKERDCNRSGTLRVLPPLPFPSLRSRYVLDDVTRFLACPMTALIGETDGCRVRVLVKCVYEYVYEYVFQWRFSSSEASVV
jgi:hypothetical protein